MTNATLIRTRGIISIKTDQAVTGEVQLGAFGLAIVEDRARAVGIAAVPIPGTNAADDAWFVHQFVVAKYDLVTAVGFDPNMVTQYVIDSKAMRKITDNAMVAVFENQGATGFDTSIQLRFLFKRA